jgi:hypothetical protein
MDSLKGQCRDIKLPMYGQFNLASFGHHEISLENGYVVFPLKKIISSTF